MIHDTHTFNKSHQLCVLYDDSNLRLLVVWLKINFATKHGLVKMVYTLFKVIEDGNYNDDDGNQFKVDSPQWPILLLFFCLKLLSINRLRTGSSRI